MPIFKQHANAAISPLDQTFLQRAQKAKSNVVIGVVGIGVMLGVAFTQAVIGNEYKEMQNKPQVVQSAIASPETSQSL